MPFSVREFPGQTFRTMEEYQIAREKRAKVEKQLSERALSSQAEESCVTATIIPAGKETLERKMMSLELEVERLFRLVNKNDSEENTNSEGLTIGTVLRGKSKEQFYTLEVIEGGYLCSNGDIYQSLSGAALGVSGNRRSGWKFWKTSSGQPVGEITGRFDKHANSSEVDP